MSLTLYYHPLSSFCHKVLVALYEKSVPFKPQLVDLGDEGQRTAFRALWPIGKFPVLKEDESGEVIAESTIIIDYLDQNFPDSMRLVPEAAAQARAIRKLDRLFDLYVHLPMQKIVGDRLRTEANRDPQGVDEAKRTMRTALGVLEIEMEARGWAAGEHFSLADCAAAPALFYADKVMPIGPDYPRMAAYLDRLKQRPSYARVLEEAQPYFNMFPA